MSLTSQWQLLRVPIPRFLTRSRTVVDQSMTLFYWAFKTVIDQSMSGTKGRHSKIFDTLWNCHPLIKRRVISGFRVCFFKSFIDINWHYLAFASLRKCDHIHRLFIVNSSLYYYSLQTVYILLLTLDTCTNHRLAGRRWAREEVGWRVFLAMVKDGLNCGSIMVWEWLLNSTEQIGTPYLLHFPHRCCP